MAKHDNRSGAAGGLKLKHQVFSPARYTREPCPSQNLLEPTDRGWPEHFRAAQFYPSHAFVPEPRGEMADENFDFRQFRHEEKIVCDAAGESKSSESKSS
jgi:hypothetical protein